MQTDPVNNSPQSAHHKNKQALELELRLMRSGLTHPKNRREDTGREEKKAMIENKTEKWQEVKTDAI